MASWMLSGGPKASSVVGFNLTADLASSFLLLPSSLAGLFFLPMVISVYRILINRARGDFGYLVHLLLFPFYRQAIWSLEFLKLNFIKSRASTTTLVKESLALPWVVKNGKMEGCRSCSVHCHWSCGLSVPLPGMMTVCVFLELCVCYVCLQGHVQCTMGIDRNVAGCWWLRGRIRGQGGQRKGGFVIEMWDLVVTGK